jgi:quinohemoprotein ethanol dehydrogenase
VEHGSQLFFTYCVYCHTDAEHTGSADLRRLSPAVHATFKDIVLHGQRLPLGMARFDDVLSNADADDIHAYLISHAWEAFLGQQQSGSTGTNGATVTH